MANHKSSLKRARQSIKRNARNRTVRSELRTYVKQFYTLLTEKNTTELDGRYPLLQKVLDKAVTKGVLHIKTASRYKSRLAARVNALKSA